MFQMSASVLTEPCGCRGWDEWDDLLGCWVRKTSVCYRHENEGAP